MPGIGWNGRSKLAKPATDQESGFAANAQSRDHLPVHNAIQAV